MGFRLARWRLAHPQTFCFPKQRLEVSHEAEATCATVDVT